MKASTNVMTAVLEWHLRADAPLLIVAKYAVSYGRIVLLKPAARVLTLEVKADDAVACSSSSASRRSACVCALKMHSPYKLLHGHACS